MRKRTDIFILDRGDRPLAAVEVKNLPNLSLPTATGLRDGLTERLAEPPRYVLVVSQETGYIWAYDRNARRFGDPETVDLRPIVQSYGSLVRTTDRLRGHELALLLSGWLVDVARFLDDGWPNTRPGGLFGRFLSDLRGARVMLEAAA